MNNLARLTADLWTIASFEVSLVAVLALSGLILMAIYGTLFLRPKRPISKTDTKVK